MQSLATATKVKPLTKAQHLQLLELEDLELQLEQEARRRAQLAESTPVVRIETKHKNFVAAYPLRDFIRETFSVIEQGREFNDYWHISIICELLQAVVIGDVRNFIINQPRRTMKSLLTCVMFPCWVWTFLPHLRFLFTSYTEKFARRDNKKCLDLISSSYYQRRFGHAFALTTERQDFIGNTAGGFRTVFKIGKGTGEGGDFVIADDPNAIDEVESELVLARTNIGWNEVSFHNVADRNTASRGVVQQRTAPNELTGYILEDDELRKLYVALTLPMKYEADHPNRNSPEKPLRLGRVSEYEKARNPRLIIGEEKLWIDPRDLNAPNFPNVWYREWYRENFTEKGLTSTGEGQLLLEGYLSEEALQQDIAHLKAYGEASQYQQRPYPRGGQFFNSEKFEIIQPSKVSLNNLVYCRYWDKAGSDNTGDWTVGMLMARTKTRPFTFYIIDIVRFQKSYFERMKEIRRVSQEDYKDYVESKHGTEYTVGIEREGGSSGKDVSLIEKEELIGFDVWIDFKKESKEQRAKLVRQRAEGGFIKVFANSAWNNIFFKRLEKFDPKKKNQKDDEIDTMTGDFYYLGFRTTQQTASTGGYM